MNPLYCTSRTALISSADLEGGRARFSAFLTMGWWSPLTVSLMPNAEWVRPALLEQVPLYPQITL
ncbi:MAG: hypothetical protein GY696_18760 [Gammaproteobacteria bacterium]|nr:hypothetical protein [Gammaproteobacteria bacterium]